MASLLSLKIHYPDNNATKTVQFYGDKQVLDVVKDIKEKLNDPNANPAEYGLFWPSGKKWILYSKTLDFYDLKNGDLLEYRKKIRMTKIKLPDNSLKTVIIDESLPVHSLTDMICKKIRIPDSLEYSIARDDKPLLSDCETEPAESDLTESAPDEIEWLNPEKSLSEQDVKETDVLLVRKKFFLNDKEIDTSDPIQLHLIFVQAKNSIMSGDHILKDEEVIRLTALLFYISNGAHYSKSIARIKDFIPPNHIFLMTKKDVDKNIQEELKKLEGISDIDAKFKFVEFCRNLTTYGITYFEVKEKQGNRNRFIPILLGVTKEKILRVDPNTREILQIWQLTDLKRWASTSNEFTMDFGVASSFYAVKTLDGDAISQLIAGYIELIVKKIRKVKSEDEKLELNAQLDENTKSLQAGVKGSAIVTSSKAPKKAIINESIANECNAVVNVSSSYNQKNAFVQSAKTRIVGNGSFAVQSDDLIPLLASIINANSNNSDENALLPQAQKVHLVHESRNISENVTLKVSLISRLKGFAGALASLVNQSVLSPQAINPKTFSSAVLVLSNLSKSFSTEVNNSSSLESANQKNLFLKICKELSNETQKFLFAVLPALNGTAANSEVLSKSKEVMANVLELVALVEPSSLLDKEFQNELLNAANEVSAAVKDIGIALKSNFVLPRLPNSSMQAEAMQMYKTIGLISNQLEFLTASFSPLIYEQLIKSSIEESILSVQDATNCLSDKIEESQDSTAISHLVKYALKVEESLVHFAETIEKILIGSSDYVQKKHLKSANSSSATINSTKGVLQWTQSKVSTLLPIFEKLTISNDINLLRSFAPHIKQLADNIPSVVKTLMNDNDNRSPQDRARISERTLILARCASEILFILSQPLSENTATNLGGILKQIEAMINDLMSISPMDQALDQLCEACASLTTAFAQLELPLSQMQQRIDSNDITDSVDDELKNISLKTFQMIASLPQLEKIMEIFSRNPMETEAQLNMFRVAENISINLKDLLDMAVPFPVSSNASTDSSWILFSALEEGFNHLSTAEENIRFALTNANDHMVPLQVNSNIEQFKTIANGLKAVLLQPQNLIENNRSVQSNEDISQQLLSVYKNISELISTFPSLIKKLQKDLSSSNLLKEASSFCKLSAEHYSTLRNNLLGLCAKDPSQSDQILTCGYTIGQRYTEIMNICKMSLSADQQAEYIENIIDTNFPGIVKSIEDEFYKIFKCLPSQKIILNSIKELKLFSQGINNSMQELFSWDAKENDQVLKQLTSQISEVMSSILQGTSKTDYQMEDFASQAVLLTANAKKLVAVSTKLSTSDISKAELLSFMSEMSNFLNFSNAALIDSKQMFPIEDIACNISELLQKILHQALSLDESSESSEIETVILAQSKYAAKLERLNEIAAVSPMSYSQIVERFTNNSNLLMTKIEQFSHALSEDFQSNADLKTVVSRISSEIAGICNEMFENELFPAIWAVSLADCDQETGSKGMVESSLKTQAISQAVSEFKSLLHQIQYTPNLEKTKAVQLVGLIAKQSSALVNIILESAELSPSPQSKQTFLHHCSALKQAIQDFLVPSLRNLATGIAVESEELKTSFNPTFKVLASLLEFVETSPEFRPIKSVISPTGLKLQKPLLSSAKLFSKKLQELLKPIKSLNSASSHSWDNEQVVSKLHSSALEITSCLNSLKNTLKESTPGSAEADKIIENVSNNIALLEAAEIDCMLMSQLNEEDTANEPNSSDDDSQMMVVSLCQNIKLELPLLFTAKELKENISLIQNISKNLETLVPHIVVISKQMAKQKLNSNSNSAEYEQEYLALLNPAKNLTQKFTEFVTTLKDPFKQEIPQNIKTETSTCIEEILKRTNSLKQESVKETPILSLLRNSIEKVQWFTSRTSMNNNENSGDNSFSSTLFKDSTKNLISGATELGQFFHSKMFKSSENLYLKKLELILNKISNSYCNGISDNTMNLLSSGGEINKTSKDLIEKVRSLGSSLSLYMSNFQKYLINPDKVEIAQQNHSDSLKKLSTIILACLQSLKSATKGVAEIEEAISIVDGAVIDLEASILYSEASDDFLVNSGSILSLEPLKTSLMNKAKNLADSASSGLLQLFVNNGDKRKTSIEYFIQLTQASCKNYLELSTEIAKRVSSDESEKAYFLNYADKTSWINILSSCSSLGKALKEILEFVVKQSKGENTSVSFNELSTTYTECIKSLVGALREIGENVPVQNSISTIVDSAIQEISQCNDELESPTPALGSALPLDIISSAKNISRASAKLMNLGINPDAETVQKYCDQMKSTVVDFVRCIKAFIESAPMEVKQGLRMGAKETIISVVSFCSKIKDCLENEVADLAGLSHGASIIGYNIHKITEAMANVPPTGYSNLDDPDVIAERELLSVSSTIDSAAKIFKDFSANEASPTARNELRLSSHTIYSLVNTDDSSDKSLEQRIFDAAKSIATIVSNLMKASTATQREIAASNKNTLQTSEAYLASSQWTEGLISAAKNVASHTAELCSSAKDILDEGDSCTNADEIDRISVYSREKFIVCVKNVNSSTSQLISAASVKASKFSKNFVRLKAAGKTIINACERLQSLIEKSIAESEKRAAAVEAVLDPSKATAVGTIAQEMEAQMQVLKMEKDLSSAREKLSKLRKSKYNAVAPRR